MEESQVNFNDKKPISLNLDEFDLDSFELKPINKGLGFHEDQKREKSVTQSIKATSSSLRHTTKSSPSLAGNKFLQNTPQTVANNGLMSGVEAIYGSPQQKNKQNITKKVVKENFSANLKEANYLNIVTAFVIDTSIVLSTTLILFTFFYLLGFEILDITGFRLFLMDSIAYVLLFFSLSFLSYFSLLEPVGTIGKRMLSLKVCQTNSSSSVNIRQSFVRSLVTLMSLSLAAVPLILDFQGKLSDSRVVQL